MLVQARRARWPRWRETRTLAVARASGRLGALALLIALSTLLLPQTARGHGGATVTTDLLNLRSGPGTWAEIINQMWQGEVVDILDGPTEDGWYQVRYRGQVGWAFGDYLGVNGADAGANAASVGSVGATAWVATDALNMRAWASLEADVVDLLYHGEVVTVTGWEVNGFVPVSAHGISAWVWHGYLFYGGAVDPGPERWIDINRTTQTVTLYVGSEPIASYWAALGFDPSNDGFYATAIGTYYVYDKYAPLSWTDWGQAYIRYWVGFDPSRLNGFHSYSMDAYGSVLPWGAGPTGGCVALDPWAAQQLFEFATIGMRVEVHW
jgi:uncharacterized protein YgiM (DUF1202 family)